MEFDEEEDVEIEKVRILNRLPFSDFNRLYGEAVFQEGKGNIIGKMAKLLENQQSSEYEQTNEI